MSTYTPSTNSNRTTTDDTHADAHLRAMLADFGRTGPRGIWEHPRAPRVERIAERVSVLFGGVTIAETTDAVRLLRPTRAPVYFIPPADVRSECLLPSTAQPTPGCFMPVQYWHVRVGDAVKPAAAWSYPDPFPPFEAIRDHVAFDANRMDGCFVGEKWVVAEGSRPGAGWLTYDSQVVAALQACANVTHW